MEILNLLLALLHVHNIIILFQHHHPPHKPPVTIPHPFTFPLPERAYHSTTRVQYPPNLPRTIPLYPSLPNTGILSCPTYLPHTPIYPIYHTYVTPTPTPNPYCTTILLYQHQQFFTPGRVRDRQPATVQYCTVPQCHADGKQHKAKPIN